MNASKTVSRKLQSPDVDTQVQPVAQPEELAQPEDHSVIAKLVKQLRVENDRIAELVERQRKLRSELLQAQERKLAELRHQQD